DGVRAVEEAERLDDERRRLVLLLGQRLADRRERVGLRRAALGDRDRAQPLAVEPVAVQVAPQRERRPAGRSGEPDPRRLRVRAAALAHALEEARRRRRADACERGVLERADTEHVVGEPGVERERGRQEHGRREAAVAPGLSREAYVEAEEQRELVVVEPARRADVYEQPVELTPLQPAVGEGG